MTNSSANCRAARIICRAGLPRVVAALFAVTHVAALRAQSPDACAGHWEGAIELPGAKLAFDVDLARLPTAAAPETSPFRCRAPKTLR